MPKATMIEPLGKPENGADPHHPKIAGRPRQTWSTRDAAEVLGLAERSVRRAIARGELAAVRHGSAYRIDDAELVRFADRPRPVVAAPAPASLVVLPAAQAPYHPLPAPVAPFVGRGHELRVLTGLLADPAARIVTLTGPGGTGKTRLAIAAATAAQDRFPDGVAFVDLAAITRSEFVVPAIAQALGLREARGRDHGDQVRAFLRGKRLLLLLDNVEQVLGAAADIGRLAVEAPGTTLLVTSRALLRVGGEREVAVAPLSLAATGADAAALLASDAGRFFVDRARAHDPGFAVDEAAAPLVAEICARLDGLPLAIELAAARVKLLPPRRLLERLERRLPLLTGGRRDAPERHRTVRDAIAWSHDLLAPPERRLFRRLAVFAGGCTLEAAAVMVDLAGGDRPDGAAADDALDLVGALLDQSLLVREPGPDGEPRFRMLETVREYGLEQLALAGEADAARSRHARCFLELAHSLRQIVTTRSTQAPLDRLAADHANLLAALAWLDERGPAAEFVALVADLAGFWFAFCHHREGQAWFERALTRSDEAAAGDRARLTVGAAGLLARQGELARAEPLYEEGLGLSRAVGDPFDIATALISRAAALTCDGRYDEAAALLAEASALAETLEDTVLRAAVTGSALANLGVSARGQGDLEQATTWGEEALRRYRRRDLDLAEVRALMDLGDVAHDRGDLPLAVERYRACIGRIGERGDMRVVADALTGIAGAATAWGLARPALHLFGAADALRERVGAALLHPNDIAAATRNLAALGVAHGAQTVADLLAEGRALPLAEAVAVAGTVAPVAAGRGAADPTPRAGLTPRELDVLRLLAEWRTDREIAEALFLSPRTVSWHVRSIIAKLGAESRRDGIAQARAKGLV